MSPERPLGMGQRRREEEKEAGRKLAVMLSVGQSGINCFGIESRSAPDYCGHWSEGSSMGVQCLRFNRKISTLYKANMVVRETPGTKNRETKGAQSREKSVYIGSCGSCGYCGDRVL